MTDYGDAMTHEPVQPVAPDSLTTRRTVLVGGAAVACAGLLGACGSSGGTASGSSTTTPAGGATSDIATADVPVGGGKILDNPAVVVTQPTAGSYKAFSSICTHAGCAVSEVQQSQIVCPCHGSVFSAADGSVLQGPAQTPLTPVGITVNGSTISITG
jgi:nitrite reductase/ring-hydroxylating ferredoxin subunit